MRSDAKVRSHARAPESRPGGGMGHANTIGVLFGCFGRKSIALVCLVVYSSTIWQTL